MLKDAASYRRHYEDISGTLVLAAADGDATLKSARAGHTLYIQRILVNIVTAAAQTLTFKDSNSSAKIIAFVEASAAVGTLREFDFGAQGIPLTEAKNFLLDVAAAGVAATIAWEGYQKQTAALSASAKAAA